MIGWVMLLPWRESVLRIRYSPFRGGSTTPMVCQNGGRNAAPLPPPVEGLPMKTMRTMATSVPIVPMRLCRVAASSAHGEADECELGPQFPEVGPDIGVGAEDRAGEQIDHKSGKYRVAEQRQDSVVGCRRFGALHREGGAEVAA